MATSSAIRADDVSGKEIATRTATEDAVTKHFQRVHISDPTTPAQELAIDASGNAGVKAAANSGTDIGDVTVNNGAGASAVNIQDGGNSITVDGTFWQATQPVSAASLPLPTGAATAAKQPALGTAGTPSADVVTVQGVTSMTALKVDGSAVTQPVSDGGGSLTVDGTVAATQSGAWNVGTVTTVTNVVHVDDNAGSLTVDGTVAVSGTVAVTDNSGSLTVDNAGTFAVQVAAGPATPGVTLLSAAIAASTSGNNTIVAAAGAGNKIYVVSFTLSFSGTVNAKFQSGAGGTDLTGLYYGIANSGAGASISAPGFLFATAANTLLNLNLSGATAVGGHVTYYIGT